LSLDVSLGVAQPTLVLFVRPGLADADADEDEGK
jgi:hypothetical protein